MRANNILETIGNTPHCHINLCPARVEVWMKLERTPIGHCAEIRLAGGRLTPSSAWTRTPIGSASSRGVMRAERTAQSRRPP